MYQTDIDNHNNIDIDIDKMQVFNEVCHSVYPGTKDLCPLFRDAYVRVPEYPGTNVPRYAYRVTPEFVHAFCGFLFENFLNGYALIWRTRVPATLGKVNVANYNTTMDVKIIQSYCKGI